MRPSLLDLERIRRELFLTLQEMAEKLTVTGKSAGLATVPATRIHEWERGARSVPHYVYCAYAQVVTDCWRAKRGHRVRPEVLEVDLQFSRLINPALAPLLCARENLRTHPHGEALELVEDALEQALAHYRYLFGVDLSFCLAAPNTRKSDAKSRKPSRRFPRGVPMHF